MLRTDALGNSLEPATRLPFPSGSFLVLRVLVSFSFNHGVTLPPE